MTRPLRERGAAFLESALMLPILFLLLFGMIEIARVTFTYYSLQKTLYTIVRLVGVYQGVNFCGEADVAVTTAKNVAITGTSDGSGESYIVGLAAEDITIRIERIDPTTGASTECECSLTGCDAASGGVAPQYVVAYLPEGYPIRLNIPGLLTDPIPLRPSVRVPFGGT